MLFLNKKQAIFSFFSKKTRKTFFNSIFYEIFTYQSFCSFTFPKNSPVFFLFTEIFPTGKQHSFYHAYYKL